MTAPTELGRWGDAFFIRGRSDAQCRFCGKGGPDGDHRATVCPACDMRVCLSPIRDECPICFYGVLDVRPTVYHRERPMSECGYAHCDGVIVARAPRVGAVCLACLDRPKIGARTLGEHIRQRAESVRTAGRLNNDPNWRFIFTPESGGAS